MELTMPVEIVMPKLHLTMTEAIIVEWRKKEGDAVKKGDVLFVLETEKVTFEVESPEDGILGKILVGEKETVPAGALVGYLLKPGEGLSDLEGVRLEKVDVGGQPELAEEPSPPVQKEMREETRIKVSPLARKMAKAYNLDLGTVRGSGPGGRITQGDVEKAYAEIQKKAATATMATKGVPAHRLVSFTGMRRAIAKKMLAAKVETAQTYMSNTLDATGIVEARKTLLPYIQGKFGVRVTITDILMKITGAAIREHAVMNTVWTEDGILYPEEIHMGMAMALDEGLIVPVIRDINGKSLDQIAKERIELIQKGKENRFLHDDITGSTFTLSTLGMFGIEQFTANINLPESAILAVGAIIDKPAAIDGKLVIRPLMNVTLTYDHRIIDGAEAAKFLRTLKVFIEDPMGILS
jgi:pyruvate dehydrogenase E2 component (dihydrolipoamide acetyltransferase)